MWVEVSLLLADRVKAHGAAGHQNQCINKQEFGTANHDQGCVGTAVAWDISCLFKIPDEIESEFAGPLMCGGATVWSPLYDFGIKPGSRVGILGVGGLGHLGIQFASKMGMDVVVFSGSENKRQQAMDLGASEFHVAQGPGNLDKVEKINALLITASVLPHMEVSSPSESPTRTLMLADICLSLHSGPWCSP